MKKLKHEHIERIKPRATGRHERRGMNERLGARRNVQQQVRGHNKRGSAAVLKGKECEPSPPSPL